MRRRSWKSNANRNKAFVQKQVQKQIHFGPCDILITSPNCQINPGADCWAVHIHPDHATKGGSSDVIVKNIKELKALGEATGWAMTFCKVKFDRWYSIDDKGDPNVLKLADFLDNEEIVAMLHDRSLIKTLTYKETLDGPQISRAQAIENSKNWVPTVGAQGNLDDIPTSDDAFSSPSSSAGSSSASATPSSGPAGKRARR